MNEHTKEAFIKFLKTVGKTVFTAGVALATTLLTQCGI